MEDAMNKKRRIALVLLIALAAVAASAVAAQAETQELVSSESNSLCINPKSMKPLTSSGALNVAPLTKSHNGPFPENAKVCAPETPLHATAMNTPGGPGEKAAPYNGAIPNASWVSISPSGSNAANPPPAYYIYNTTFKVPCHSQIAGSEINVKMFADNAAGAFLNGKPIGNLAAGAGQQNFDQESTTPHGPVGGWPFGPNVGAGGGFKFGLNTLQFVVLDEGGGFTGLDFSALVSSPPCMPWWYSNGKLLKEGEVEPVTTSAALTMRSGETTTKCKVRDKETIENPIGGGAGTDEMTEYVLSGCATKPSPCVGTKEEIVARKLPWHTHLTYGPPIRDVIEGIELEVKCGGTLLDTFTGELSPAVGKSKLEFGAGSGALEDGLKNQGTFTGTDKLTGPPGDEKITAG
jgi:hypothetical protein